MIIERLSIGELQDLVRSHCVKMKKKFETLVEGEFYEVEHDIQKNRMDVYDDQGKRYVFEANEAAEYLDD